MVGHDLYAKSYEVKMESDPDNYNSDGPTRGSYLAEAPYSSSTRSLCPRSTRALGEQAEADSQEAEEPGATPLPGETPVHRL
jgi:hypothetical protein